MDCKKVGELLRTLRTERHMTQKQLADTLHLSDKTISKWERGMGCPDISLLPEISSVFGISAEQILAGTLTARDTDGGNMKQIKFYVCPTCGNCITATAEAEISCCGRKMTAYAAKPCDDEHTVSVEPMEDELHLTFSHPMTKEHYLTFVAYVAFDKVLFVKLYPEQSGELRIPRLYGGKLYIGCNRDGLYVQ